MQLSCFRSAAAFAIAMAIGAGGCGAAQGSSSTRNVPIAARCEVTHSVRDVDTVESTITRDGDSWMVTLTMRVRLASSDAPIEIHGSGRVSGPASRRACRIEQPGGNDAQPRFDEDLCLDEFESVADVLGDAEGAARPGETVVQEVRLHASRHRRRRRRSARMARPANFQERAEITRDPQGRVIRLSRSTEQGGREQMQVAYPSGEDGHCLPVE
jgi:hypothetical protein